MTRRAMIQTTAGGYSRPAWRFGELLKGQIALPERFAAAAQLQITDLAIDSSNARPGTLFLACPKDTGHGLDYAENARRHGAVAILAEPDAHWTEQCIHQLATTLALPILPVEHLNGRLSALGDRFFDSPSRDLEVCGVTGNQGKTSLCHYLASALSVERRCGLLSDLGTGFPDALSVNAQHDGEAISVQRQLAELRARGAHAAVLETSFTALRARRFAHVRLRHAVLTCRTSSCHADAHHMPNTEADIVKWLLERAGLRWAIFDADDPLTDRLCSELAPDVAIGVYSLRVDAVAPKRCDLWLRMRSMHAQRASLRLEVELQGRGREERERVELAALGHCNAANLLAALALLCARGLTLARAIEMLAPVRAAPGRMECFGDITTPLVVVDRARTPPALVSVLEHLRTHRPRHILSVIDLESVDGLADNAQMLSLLKAAGRLSSRLIVSAAIADDEQRKQQVTELLTLLPDAIDIHLAHDRAMAIRLALASASQEDLVLVAGTGHERRAAPGAVPHVRFSDRAEVMQALNEWRGGQAR